MNTMLQPPVSATFDADKFRSTTRAQWQSAAQPWHRWGLFIGSWLADATEAMFDMARVGPGCHVLDVAAGAGEQSLRAARRVGVHGRVLATDIAPALLAYAESDAQAAGLSNIVTTREIGGEALTDLPAGTFDVAISRVGLIYFPDQQRALEGMKHALKAGGRVAAIVYATADRNQFFSIPVKLIRERAGLPAPLPGQPGPFSLGGDGVLEAALARAGFKDIAVQRVPSPVRMPSAAECVRFERESFGALHQMMSTLDDDQRLQVWHDIEVALAQFETQDGFVGPCEMLVAVGTA